MGRILPRVPQIASPFRQRLKGLLAFLSLCSLSQESQEPIALFIADGVLPPPTWTML